jgi:hypothetical protein
MLVVVYNDGRLQHSMYTFDPDSRDSSSDHTLCLSSNITTPTTSCLTHHRQHNGNRQWCSAARLLHQPCRLLSSSHRPQHPSHQRQHPSLLIKSEDQSSELHVMLVQLPKSSATRNTPSAADARQTARSASTECQGSMESQAEQGRGTQTARLSSRPLNNDPRQMAANSASSESDLSPFFRLCQTSLRRHPTGRPTGRLLLACQAHQTSILNLHPSRSTWMHVT